VNRPGETSRAVAGISTDPVAREPLRAAAEPDAPALPRGLPEILCALWPAPARITIGTGPQPEDTLARFLLAGRRSTVPYLLPVETARAAATAVRRFHQGQTWMERRAREALSAGLATGLAQRCFRTRITISRGSSADTINDLLARVFGEPVVFAVGIGSLRANRKPVLQVMTPAGRSLGYVKIGWNDITRPLVRSEAQTLALLGQLSPQLLAVPEVLHSELWHDLEVLVLSPLPQSPRRFAPYGEVPLAPMREIAGIGGPVPSTLADSVFWQHMISSARAEDADLAALLARLDPLVGGTPVALGSWHGDWTPWNMSYGRSRPVVWDWERFATGVPVGFDALHYRYQSLLRLERQSPPAAISRLQGEASGLLHSFAVPETLAQLFVLLYLLELFRRYRVDALRPEGQQLGPVLDAMRPELHRIAGELLPAAPGAAT